MHTIKHTYNKKMKTPIIMQTKIKHKKKNKSKKNGAKAESIGKIKLIQQLNKQKQKMILVEKTKIEYLLLFNTLLNYYILLVSNNLSNDERKHRLEELALQMRDNNKLISKDTSDIQIKNIVDYLDTFFQQLLLLINQSLESSQHKKHSTYKKNNDKKQSHRGGFYFKSLEEKGEKPITGADLTKLLDEMQQFFYNAKYTEEGKFLQDTDTLLSMLRGDVNQFKGILQYRIFPQFYNAYPPFIKWDAIYSELIEKRRWEDLPDYLLAYQSYLRSRDEYLVEKGLKPPSILQRDLYTGFYNKMANSINDNITAFQQARNKFQGRFFPITLPP
jgi:hypothetical protein